MKEKEGSMEEVRRERGSTNKATMTESGQSLHSCGPASDVYINRLQWKISTVETSLFVFVVGFELVCLAVEAAG